MKFKLTATRTSFINPENHKEEIENLKKLGFQFKEYKAKIFGNYCPVSRIINKPIINIKNIDELLPIIKICGEIVLSKDTIEIYNDYRE